MSLATNIEYLMQLQSITPQELANLTNIDRSTLTRILNGSTTQPRLETIHTLAKYFNVTTDSLLNDEYNKEFKSTNHNHNKSLKDNLTWVMSKTGIINISLLHKYTTIPLSVLSDILNGKTEKPNIKTLQKLSKFFNLSIPQLMGNEAIIDSQLIVINPDRRYIPLIHIDKISTWLKSHDSKDLESISVNRPVLDPNAFAIKLESEILEPDFIKNQILVIDIQDPENGDFIVASVNTEISIYEYEVKNSRVYLRMAGTLKWKEIIPEKLLIHGVVIQQIINRR